MGKSIKVAIGIVAAVAVLGVGGSWVYINLIKEDAPEELTLDDADPSAPTTTADDGAAPTTDGAVTDSTDDGLDGTWTVSADGTEVGYRVKEVLFGQDTEGVGRTSEVTGSLTLAGTSVTAATFSVDVASITSDESRRDSAFRGDVMNTAEFPEATFELTAPIELGTLPDPGTEITATATGRLTLRGETKDVELPLQAKLDGDRISVLGNYEVVFEEWGIPNPSRGPVTTEDRGTLEILLSFERA